MHRWDKKPHNTKNNKDKKRKATNKMIAMTTNDKCYSTKGLARIFNTDGIEREELDPAEVRSALDFNIVKKPSYDADGRQIPGHFHLVREDNNMFIPSASIGNKFEPVQHLSVFDYITKEIMPRVPEMSLEAVGTIHGCGTGIIMSKIGDAFHIAGDDSPNNMRLMFSNPCNGYGSLIIGFTNVRLFCQNQIPVAMRQAKQDGFQIRHTKNAELYVGSALSVINASIQKAREIRIKSEGLAKVNVNSAFIKRVMDSIYPFKPEVDEGTIGFTKTENRRQEVIRQFESGETAQSVHGDTAWKLFNAFTYPIYNPTTTKKSVDAAEVAYTGAVGQRGVKVSRIFNTIFNETMRMVA